MGFVQDFLKAFNTTEKSARKKKARWAFDESKVKKK